jgi:hypothetical protein
MPSSSSSSPIHPSHQKKQRFWHWVHLPRVVRTGTNRESIGVFSMCDFFGNRVYLLFRRPSLHILWLWSARLKTEGDTQSDQTNRREGHATPMMMMRVDFGYGRILLVVLLAGWLETIYNSHQSLHRREVLVQTNQNQSLLGLPHQSFGRQGSQERHGDSQYRHPTCSVFVVFCHRRRSR